MICMSPLTSTDIGKDTWTCVNNLREQLQWSNGLSRWIHIFSLWLLEGITSQCCFLIASYDLLALQFYGERCCGIHLSACLSSVLHWKRHFTTFWMSPVVQSSEWRHQLDKRSTDQQFNILVLFYMVTLVGVVATAFKYFDCPTLFWLATRVTHSILPSLPPSLPSLFLLLPPSSISSSLLLVGVRRGEFGGLVNTAAAAATTEAETTFDRVWIVRNCEWDVVILLFIPSLRLF